MLQIKEGFVDRIEQSIILLKNNILKITLPIVVFNILFMVIIPAIISGLLPLTEIFSGSSSEKIGILIPFAIALGGTYFLIYIGILIPVQISVIKSIKDCIYEKEINIRENIYFGFKTISQIFRTYWYIFIYVYLIPASLFIVGGILFIASNFGLPESLQIISTVGIILMILSTIVFSVFAIYRGTKSTFGVISAIDSQEYSKENLQKSVLFSDKKWWRVFWNIFGAGFIIGVILQLVKFIGNMFIAFSYDWTDLLMAQQNSADINIQELIADFTQFNITSFINKVFQTGVSSILGVFIVIFTYLLFKRLQSEFIYFSSKGKTTQQEL